MNTLIQSSAQETKMTAAALHLDAPKPGFKDASRRPLKGGFIHFTKTPSASEIMFFQR
jgi:hypothetical protein